tara:strand:+ start:108 stop:473 length:366 start_codon:yes stop_codon:yes gene_type:complete
MSILGFEQEATIIIGHVVNKCPKWDGDLIDLDDNDKDAFCYHFLQNMESWWDDVLPAVCENQEAALHAIYAQSEKDNRLAILLKNSIYLYIESIVRELIQNLYDTLNEVECEPFAGYERGE